MRFSSLLLAFALLFAAPTLRAEPAEAPQQVDLTPAIPVLEIPVPAEARMSVVAARGAAAGVARSLAGGLVAERETLETLLGGLDAGHMEVRFAYGRDEFAALQPRGGRAPGWAAGVAWPQLGLVVIDAQASGRGGDVRTVLRHELAHVALGRLIQGHTPRWFTEGFAQLYAGEWTLSRSTTLARATVAGALIPVRDIEQGWPGSPTDVDLAYAQSVSFVSWLASTGDGAGLQRLLRHLGEGEPFPDALVAAYGKPLLVLELDWRDTLRTRYGWLPLVTDTNLVLGFGGLLLVVGAWQARRRRRRQLDAMEDGPELPEPESVDEADESLPGPQQPNGPAPLVIHWPGPVAATAAAAHGAENRATATVQPRATGTAAAEAQPAPPAAAEARSAGTGPMDSRAGEAGATARATARAPAGPDEAPARPTGRQAPSDKR